jgi:hypothetical protein
MHTSSPVTNSISPAHQPGQVPTGILIGIVSGQLNRIIAP